MLILSLQTFPIVLRPQAALAHFVNSSRLGGFLWKLCIVCVLEARQVNFFVRQGGSAYCNVIVSCVPLHPRLLQGHNFSLILEATGASSPPRVSGFGLLLNGCFLPEYYLPAASSASFDSSAASRWNLTLTLSLAASSAAPVEMNGWWVVPAHEHGHCHVRVRQSVK